MIGKSLGEFRAHLEHHMRVNGFSTSEEFSRACGELPSMIDLVREGSQPPTSAILGHMGYVRFQHSYYGWALMTEERYMKKTDAVDSEKRMEVDEYKG